MGSIPEREQISEEYKWDLEKAYSDLEEWEDDFREVQEMAEELKSYRGEVTESPSKLLDVLKKREKLLRKLSKLRSFASMRSDEDKRDQDAQALSSRAGTVSSEIHSKIAFIEPEIEQSTREELQEMIEQEEDLVVYGQYFDELMRLKEHTRSEEVEELLADLSKVLSGSSETYSFLMNADLSFPTVEKPDGGEVELTISNFTKLQKNSDREFRKDVYDQFYDRFSEFRNTISTTLENTVRKQAKLARQRNYESTRQASLKPSNIPEEVYDNLVSTVEDNLDVLHEHVRLKAEALGVDKIGMHDIYTPLRKSEPEIEFEDAKEHVLEALQPLGEDYVEKAREGLENGWIDVYENKGKRSGAYSGGSYDTHPYILMNYQDDIQSMYTLAHELGHSMHSYYTTDNQPHIYGGYELFVAEVASTTNEMLLTRHLLETVDDEEFRAHVLSHVLEDFRNTLFRQTMFADFEHAINKEVEEGNPLTPDRLDELYGERKEKFYKPAEVDDRIRREWMRIPHFYYNFYVFQYATGISAATALSEKILESEEQRDNYLEFLKSGSSKYPIELLKLAGVNMESPKPIQEAIDVYAGYIEEMGQYVSQEK